MNKLQENISISSISIIEPSDNKFIYMSFNLDHICTFLCNSLPSNVSCNLFKRGKKHTDDVEVSKMHVPKLQSNLLYSCFIYKFHFIYFFSLIKLYFIYQCIKIQFQT